MVTVLIDQKEYKEALVFKADGLVIHLGTNDTDPRNWPEYAEEFNANYRTRQPFQSEP